MIRSRCLAAAACAVFAAGCGLDDAERAALDRWYHCEDCLAGELDSVAALGNRAVDALSRGLAGPTADQRTNIGLQAAAAYDRLRLTGSPAPPPPAKAAYVATFEENFVATYQSRAAVALARIGTPRARNVLLDALRNDAGYRRDVRRRIGRSLGTTLSLLGGDSQTVAGANPLPNPVTFQVTDGAGPVEGVPVRFALDPGSGVLADTIATTDAAGVAPLPGWTVVGGWSVLRATGAGGVVRVAARADPPFDATNFVATLTGAERVPPIATPATGLANLTFTGVAITYNVDVSNVSGVVRVMLHVGSPGATGPVALALCGEATAPACASGPGVITAGSSAAPIGITLPVLVDSLRRQQTYIRVATTTHPAGLIRGQVLSVFP